MKRHLFFTGPMGCGKSTAIARALQDPLPEAGGFLTRRYREPYLHFMLETPDGSQKACFLDFAHGKPQLNPAVFDDFGVKLLHGKFLLLDEIGGIELLCPKFREALQQVLDSDIPIIGVMKGEGPASKLIQTLGLTREYEEAAALLRSQIRSNQDTLLYECCQFDAYACLLAENWVKEYCP